MSESTCHRVVHDVEGLNTAIWPIPPDRLVTPVDLFFTRSHAPVPRLDPAAWRLEVDGLVDRPRSFFLEELLQAFPRRHVSATLVCAGLRRSEFLSLGPLPGELPWGPEPVSTGEWSGIALADLLREVGTAAPARHVEFTGLDRVERQGERFGFGGSIDLAKAVSGEVILATELNGAPLPAAHGFPVRVLVPGWIGARSVKWLGRITLREEPSPNYFQSKAYRLQPELDPRKPQDVSGGRALSELPLNTVILAPIPNQVVRAGRVQIRGWAMGSAGRPPTAIEVSPNDGDDWVPARSRLGGEPWTWALWGAELELAPGPHTVVARATDGTGVPQPPTVRETWNVKGYNNNAWHRVTIHAR